MRAIVVLTNTHRHRPDTIRTIVAGLVGEGSDLIDDSEPVVPLNVLAEDYSDPNWEPEPLDAGPRAYPLTEPLRRESYSLVQTSGRISQAM